MIFSVILVKSQTCPTSGNNTISTNPNTYYPGTQATVTAGSTSITLGAATIGSTAISSGDLVLIIQMQGAEINATNGDTYGDGVSGGTGSGSSGSGSGGSGSTGGTENGGSGDGLESAFHSSSRLRARPHRKAALNSSDNRTKASRRSSCGELPRIVLRSTSRPRSRPARA